MAYLRTIRLNLHNDPVEFPFNLSVVRTWETLELDYPVTFFVGENGSGKSTIMEAIACAAESITVGSENVRTDPTLHHARKLASVMKLSWHTRTRRGFFLRAEDFFGFVKRIETVKLNYEADLRAVDEEYAERSDFAKGLAKMPYMTELSNLKNKYGEGLDHQSHGESFLELFQARFVPEGLYLLDEPEAALSPLRQLGFLSLLKEMIIQKAQFIIATHSPILMAYPNANILSFDHSPIKSVQYETLEHVTLTREFLNNPESFLRHL